MEYNQLLTISLLGTEHHFTQSKEETVKDFKVRVQEYFDEKGINIQII